MIYTKGNRMIMKNTIKTITGTLVVLAIIMSAFTLAYAAVPTVDGTYSVPVTLCHAEKEKESMGNKYILQTALISVSGGKKTITVVADGVDDLTFSYYTNGTVEGDTKEAKKVEDVKIDGKTYATGFEFPLVTDNQYVGVKFKAPIMPMSPSARLKIDYSGIKTLSTAETTSQETETSAETEAEAETETAAKNETQAAESETAAEVPETQEQTETVTSFSEEETQTTGALIAEQEETETEKSSPVPIVIAAAAVAAVIIIAFVLKKKKS